MTTEDTLTLNQKIRKDWGCIKYFCKKHKINYNTFKQVIYGYQTSTQIVNLLKKYKYIKSADDIKRKVA